MVLLKRIISPIIVWWAILGGILLMGAVFVTITNVLGFSANVLVRPFGGYVPGLSGFEDMVTLWVGVVALSFMPYCQLKRGHISVDVAMKYSPQWLQSTMNLTSSILMAAIALFLAYMLWQGMAEARADGTVTAVLGWSVWIYMLPGVFSCLLWAIAAIITIHPPAETSIR